MASWQAGKYYKYNLSIGEFHVPGENLKLTDVDIAGLKNTAVIKRPLSAINIKGVSKIGLVLNNYQLGAEPGQVVYMHAIINGLDQVSYNGDPKAPTTTVSNFDFDFDPVDDTALDASVMIYEFGDETEEEYHNYYCFDQRSGSKKSKLTEYNNGVSGPLYYVFNTPGDGNKTFQIGFQPSAGSNDGGYAAGVRCLIVLEVAKDPYLPGNFPLTSWP